LLANNDQSLTGLRIDLGGKGLAPGADIDRILARITAAMETAKGLTAPPLICLDLGPLPQPAETSPPKPKVTQERAGVIIIPQLSEPAPTAQPSYRAPDPALVSNVDGAIAELGKLADRIGVTIALRSELASFAAIERAMSAAACPWFGIDLDPVAMLRDDWPSDEILSRLGPHIRHVRCRDAIAGADKRTKPAGIGRGSIEWAKLFGDLDAAGYSGWLTIDPLELSDRLAAAVAGAKHLRNISA
jgi:sugar phosphate isomerase/epimerase